ncbi:MAG: hypothetical protein ABIH20_04440 [Candidatus Diapherotrites archaeon]
MKSHIMLTRRGKGKSLTVNSLHKLLSLVILQILLVGSVAPVLVTPIQEEKSFDKTIEEWKDFFELVMQLFFKSKKQNKETNENSNELRERIAQPVKREYTIKSVTEKSRIVRNVDLTKQKETQSNYFNSVQKAGSCERGWVCNGNQSEFVDSSCQVRITGSCSQGCDITSGQCIGRSDTCLVDSDCGAGEECFDGGLRKSCVPLDNPTCEPGYYCNSYGDHSDLVDVSCELISATYCEYDCNDSTGLCNEAPSCTEGWACNEQGHSEYVNSVCEVTQIRSCGERGCNQSTGDCNENNVCERGWTCTEEYRSEFSNSYCNITAGANCDLPCDLVTGQCPDYSDSCQTDADCNPGDECFDGGSYNTCVLMDELVCNPGWSCDIEGSPERERLLDASCRKTESNICQHGCDRQTGRCIQLTDCEVGWSCTEDELFSKYYNESCDVMASKWCFNEGCDNGTGQCILEISDECQNEADCNPGMTCYDGSSYNVCGDAENPSCEDGWTCSVDGGRRYLLDSSCNYLGVEECGGFGCDNTTGTCNPEPQYEPGWNCEEYENPNAGIRYYMVYSENDEITLRISCGDFGSGTCVESTGMCESINQDECQTDNECAPGDRCDTSSAYNMCVPNNTNSCDSGWYCDYRDSDNLLYIESDCSVSDIKYCSEECFSDPYVGCGEDWVSEEPECNNEWACNLFGDAVVLNENCQEVDYLVCPFGCDQGACVSEEGDFSCNEGNVCLNTTQNTYLFSDCSSNNRIHHCESSCNFSTGECNDEAENCDSNYELACSSGDVYWYNSCGNKEEKYEDCGSAGCTDGQCNSISFEPDECTVGNPCDVGNGDCDSDNQCVSGAICSQDVGSNYGFSSGTDVCEYPDYEPDYDEYETGWTCKNSSTMAYRYSDGDWGKSMGCLFGCSNDLCEFPLIFDSSKSSVKSAKSVNVDFYSLIIAEIFVISAITLATFSIFIADTYIFNENGVLNVSQWPSNFTFDEVAMNSDYLKHGSAIANSYTQYKDICKDVMESQERHKVNRYAQSSTDAFVAFDIISKVLVISKESGKIFHCQKVRSDYVDSKVRRGIWEPVPWYPNIYAII